MDFNATMQELFDDTLDSLLRYINRRFRVVRCIDAADAAERLARMQLVERFLWDRFDLIADFVHDNPDGLTKTHLDVASGLSDTIFGTLYLEDYQDGLATLAHSTGIYTALCPKGTITEPTYGRRMEVRGAIAPFMDSIVVIPPVIVMGTSTAATVERLHRRLEGHGLSSPTGRASDLAARAIEWRQERERKMQREASSAAKHEERVGAGFHRGELAGLSPSERQAAKTAHANLVARRTGALREALDLRSIEVDDVPVTLKDALRQLDDDRLWDLVMEIGDDSIQADASRAELISHVCHRVPSDRERRDFSLMWCLDEQLELVRRLLAASPLPLDDLPLSDIEGLYPMVPYVFILKVGEAHLAWMPPEIRALLADADLARIGKARDRMGEARASAAGLATTCGIISVPEVYERYRRAVDDPLTRQQFEMTLTELETCDSRDDYALWRHHGRDFVISVEISDSNAPTRVVREHYADNIMGTGDPLDPRSPTIVRLSIEDEGRFSELVQRKQDELEQVRLSLKAAQDDREAHELHPGMLQAHPIDALIEIDALRRLRAFVDAHMPDGQDDYEFSDAFARAVVISAVLMGESYNETMDVITFFGMERCEGDVFSDTLGRLVTNAYNALPRWQLRGWSLEENTERITGRRRFFSDDGSPVNVGDAEPCPCGSGRTYGQCCGNLGLQGRPHE